jgi:hypothetical protein
MLPFFVSLSCLFPDILVLYDYARLLFVFVVSIVFCDVYDDVSFFCVLFSGSLYSVCI